MNRKEQMAYNAGLTAAERIGDKAMCYDPIMQSLVVEARTENGRERNRRVMDAWLRGRAVNEPKWGMMLESLQAEDNRKRQRKIVVNTLNKYRKKYDAVGDFDFRVYGEDGMFDVVRAEQHGISYNGRMVDREDFENLLYWNR